MKLFKIYTYKDEVLHQKATEVSLPISEEERNRLLDRVEYLKKSQDDDFANEHGIRSGVGIAAPQIGVSKRRFAIYFEDSNGKK